MVNRHCLDGFDLNVRMRILRHSWGQKSLLLADLSMYVSSNGKAHFTDFSVMPLFINDLT